MAAKITTLIDKQDTYEIIRDQVGKILKLEIENQKVLATAAEKNPDLWDMNIYIERERPYFAKTDGNGEESGALKKGIVNLFFDNDSLKNSGSDSFSTFLAKGKIMIDCYGMKSSVKEDDELKHGDELSAYEAERVCKLVRNILMSGQYNLLGFDGVKANGRSVVQKSYIASRQKYTPEPKNSAYQALTGMRLILEVEYFEYSPQVILENMESLITECYNSEGEILFTYQEGE